MKAEMMSFVCIAAVCAMAFADEPTAQAHDTAEDGAGLVATAHKWVSLSAFAEIQSAYLARGAVVDSHPFSAQLIGRGTDPAERAFYRVFRELCLAAVPESGCFRAGAETGATSRQV